MVPLSDRTGLRMVARDRSTVGLDIELVFGCGLFIVVVLVGVLDTIILCVTNGHHLVVGVGLILASDLRVAVQRVISAHELRMENIEL